MRWRAGADRIWRGGGWRHVGHGLLIGRRQLRICPRGVDLRGGDLRMAQQLAQAGDRHARFGDLTGEGVAQLVRRERHARLLAILVQQPFDAVHGQRLATVIEKDVGVSLAGRSANQAVNTA